MVAMVGNVADSLRAGQETEPEEEGSGAVRMRAHRQLSRARAIRPGGGALGCPEVAVSLIVSSYLSPKQINVPVTHSLLSKDNQNTSFVSGKPSILRSHVYFGK